MSELPVEIVVDLRVEPEAVDRVHDALDALWSHDESVDPVVQIRFATALVEVVGNVVEHAYAADGTEGGRALAARLTLTGDAVTAVISDNGQPAEIDLGSVTMPEADAESGRGLALALSAVDELRYERDGGRNRWTMVCARAR